MELESGPLSTLFPQTAKQYLATREVVAEHDTNAKLLALEEY